MVLECSSEATGTPAVVVVKFLSVIAVSLWANSAEMLRDLSIRAVDLWVRSHLNTVRSQTWVVSALMCVNAELATYSAGTMNKGNRATNK
jgi:hypothetical protein